MYISIDISEIRNILHLIEKEKEYILNLKHQLKEMCQMAYDTEDEFKHVYRECVFKIDVLERHLEGRIDCLLGVLYTFSKVKQQSSAMLNDMLSRINSIMEE